MSRSFAAGVLVFLVACGPDSRTGIRVDAGTTPDASPVGCGSEANLAGCGCDEVGAVRSCYAGPIDTRHVGLCSDGMQACVAAPVGAETYGPPGTWAPCVGDVQPAAAELCSDGGDHDCNGAAGCSDTGCASDPKCQSVCHPGETKPCYTGPSDTSGVGACHAGTVTCAANGQWEQTCAGEVTPADNEFFQCHDGVDNDCNGRTDCQDFFCLIDPGCSPQICTAGAMEPCYDGPSGTNGVATCHGGMHTCAADGKSWGACNGQVLPGSEAGKCGDGIDNDCNGAVDCADQTCASAVSCCVATTPAFNGTIYAHSPTDLYLVNPNGWTVTKIGSFQTSEEITDIAVTPSDQLYGVSFTALYSIDKATGKATYLGAVPGAGNNALTFMPDGNLLAADSAGSLKKINPSTGAVTNIGNFGQSLSSSGDLVAISNGVLYGVSSTTKGGGDASGNNQLLRIDATTGTATVVGPIGYGSVWGLAYVNATVLGFTTSGQILQIDPQTGTGTLLATRGVAVWGAGMSPKVPPVVCP